MLCQAVRVIKKISKAQGRESMEESNLMRWNVSSDLNEVRELTAQMSGEEGSVHRA